MHLRSWFCGEVACYGVSFYTYWSFGLNQLLELDWVCSLFSFIFKFWSQITEEHLLLPSILLVWKVVLVMLMRGFLLSLLGIKAGDRKLEPAELVVHGNTDISEGRGVLLRFDRDVLFLGLPFLLLLIVLSFQIRCIGLFPPSGLPRLLGSDLGQPLVEVLVLSLQVVHLLQWNEVLRKPLIDEISRQLGVELLLRWPTILLIIKSLISFFKDQEFPLATRLLSAAKVSHSGESIGGLFLDQGEILLQKAVGKFGRVKMLLLS